VQVVVVGRNRFFRLLGRECGVDQKMMMPRTRLFHTGGRDTHTAQAELNFDGALYGIAVFQIDEINHRIRWRRRLRLRHCGSGDRQR
jgi:hypothetical protein